MLSASSTPSRPAQGSNNNPQATPAESDSPPDTVKNEKGPGNSTPQSQGPTPSEQQQQQPQPQPQPQPPPQQQQQQQPPQAPPQAPPQQQRPQWEHTIRNIVPIDSLTEQIGHFLWTHVVAVNDPSISWNGREGPVIEVEAKLGQLFDSNIQERLSLPVESDCIINTKDSRLRTNFRSSMTEVSFVEFNVISLPLYTS
jgi:hypothetical protein